MLKGFCLLIKKKTQPLFVTNDMKLDGIPKQNKKKKENTHSFDNAFQVLKLLLIQKI